MWKQVEGGRELIVVMCIMQQSMIVYVVINIFDQDVEDYLVE